MDRKDFGPNACKWDEPRMPTWMAWIMWFEGLILCVYSVNKDPVRGDPAMKIAWPLEEKTNFKLSRTYFSALKGTSSVRTGVIARNRFIQLLLSQS